MSSIKDIPAWAQVVIAVVMMILAGVMAFDTLKADLRVESVERRSTDEQIKDSLLRIEKMLLEEMERHHPRGR